MKGIFNQHKNTLGINGVALVIASIIDGQATVTLPSGKKTHLPVSSLQSIEGEINFTTNEILPDPEFLTQAAPQPAPLFDKEEANKIETEDGGQNLALAQDSVDMEAAVADETDENPAASTKKKK